jgi:hypothetical protein
MPLWRVQAAWSGGIHDPIVHWNEEDAKYEVEKLFRTWLLRGMESMARTMPHPEFQRILTESAEFIREALNKGDVWKAYDFFNEFQKQLDPVFSTGKSWYHMGTVIVEAPPGEGPRTRKRFITEKDFPEAGGTPLITLRGSDVRPFQRWTVSWRHLAGDTHASYFLSEEEALEYAATLLLRLLERAEAHALEWSFSLDPDRRRYAEEALLKISEIRSLVEAGDASEALFRWRLFEDQWEGRGPFARDPLWTQIGQIRIEVEPPTGF